MSASRPRRWNNASQRFKTDGDISAAAAGSPKPLEKWVDDGSASNADALADLSLESGSPRHWDQFAANREKFGIVPSYNELHYTTEVNKSHPDFAAREKRAIQIAREIEGEAHNGNVHLAEERGVDIADANMDEEDKYSGVKRDTKAPSAERRQKFAAKEAQKAMASPGYLQSRERSDGSEDLRRFSQDFQVKGEVPADLMPILGKKPRNTAEHGASTHSTQGAPKAHNTPSSNSTGSGGGKKKFNFAAAAAKAPSFKSSFSPSPNRGSPSSLSPVPIPTSLPIPPAGVFPPVNGMMPLMMQPPFYGAPPNMPMIPMSKSVSPMGSDDLVPEPAEIKPLGDSFDYIAVLKAKGEDVPPIFTTPPTWTTNSTESYIEQLPSPQYMYQPYIPWGM